MKQRGTHSFLGSSDSCALPELAIALLLLHFQEFIKPIPIEATLNEFPFLCLSMNLPPLACGFDSIMGQGHAHTIIKGFHKRPRVQTLPCIEK